MAIVHTLVVDMVYWDGPIRLKVNGYVSESVQSDIKLSFTCIIFYFSDFCPIRLVLNLGESNIPCYV